jgi:hydrogenase maturation protease
LNTLVIGIGNPSRGDDALGPFLIERLTAFALPGVELLTDFQLQIEHVMDMRDRDLVIIADASISARAPFEYTAINGARAYGITTHALSPEEVLAVYATHYGDKPPAARLLAIRGYSFELGEGLSDLARGNLEAALRHILNQLKHPAGLDVNSPGQ